MVFFLALTSKAPAWQEELDKLNFIKIKTFHASKSNNNKVKISHKGVIYKLHVQ